MKLYHIFATVKWPCWLITWLRHWQNPGALTLSVATTLHLVEGIVLLTTRMADKSTPIAALIKSLPHLAPLSIEQSVAFWLFVVSIAALVSMHNMKLNHWVAAVLLIPQQTLLAITCIGAIAETWNGTYADGYPAPHAFILCDQLTRILLAPAYTAAIFQRAIWSSNGAVPNLRIVGG